MKKRLLVCLTAAMMMMTGCSSEVLCDWCGELKPGQTKESMGVEISLCNDCIEEMEEAFGQ